MSAAGPARWPRGPVLGVTWIAYAVLLAVTIPFTPFAILLMIAPLMVSGWYARSWVMPLLVGLGHGAALAGLGWYTGAFADWPGGLAGFGLAAAILMLLSWFAAMAGRTIQIVQVLRERTGELATARYEMDKSAASVEAIYESAAMALVVVNQQEKVASWNPGAEEMFGIPASQMVGRAFATLAAEGDPDDCMGPIRYVLQSQRDIPNFSGRLRHADGRMLHVDVRARPIELNDGDHGIVMAIVDKTQEHVMEERLFDHASMQDTLLRNLQDVLYSVEVPSMRTLLMSKTVEGLTGKEPDEFSNFRDFLDLVHPDDREALATRWRHARTGERSTLRWRIKDAQGEYAWVEDRIAPARNDDGEVVRLEGIVRRIYEEIELERQSQRMMRWLDAMEPMTGCGAWALDLRTGEWQWSGGIHDILGTRPDEEESLSTWMARLGSADAARVEALVSDPESARPMRIHVYRDDKVQECLIEPWIQRGNDGEPIWLYGLLRSREGEVTAPREGPRSGLAVAVGGTSDGGATQAATVTVQKHAPGSPEAINIFLRAALQRSRRAVADAQGMAPEVQSAVAQAAQDTVTEQMAWASGRTVPVASGASALYEPIALEIARCAEAAERAVVHRILAEEQTAAFARAAEASQAAEQADRRIEAQVAKVQEASQRAVEEAARKAEEEAARAQEAETRRQALEAAMAERLEAAEQERAAAVRRAEEAREQALKEARQAKAQAEVEAKEAEAARLAAAEAEAARAAAVDVAQKARRRAEADAEDARRRAEAEAEKAERAAAALAKAEAAREAAVEAARQARKEALQEAESARIQAEREAEQAKKATAALAQAEAAREAAAKEAEAAKLKAQSEAGEAKAEAMRLAEAAQQRAKALAKEAEDAAKARDAAQQASQQALETAKQAQQQALQEAESAKKDAERLAQEAEAAAKARDAAEAARHEAVAAAEKARQEALAEMEAAQRRAEELSKEAESAKKAREAAEAAKQQAMADVAAAREEAQAAAESAKQQAAKDAEAAIAKARADAEKARADAEKQAEQARAAEAARQEAEAAAEEAMASAKGNAAKALEKARVLREEARQEAEQARAAAAAEAAKAEQAEQARDRAIQEVQQERDRAIQEAKREREKAVAAAEAVKDRAIRAAEAAREAAEERAAALEAELARARGERVQEPEPRRTDDVPRIDIPSASQSSKKLSPWSAAAVEDVEADMDVVWDDEIGWVPVPKGEKTKDKAAELKAKKTSGAARKRGPWAMDD